MSQKYADEMLAILENRREEATEAQTKILTPPLNFVIHRSSLDRVPERYRDSVRRWNERGKDFEGVSLKPDWEKRDEKKRQVLEMAAKQIGR